MLFHFSAKSDKELEDIDLECSVRPEEVPDIPDNKFLMRDSDKNERDRNFRRMTDDRRDVSRSGRKFKGRGVKVGLIVVGYCNIIVIFYSAFGPHRLKIVTGLAVKHLRIGKRNKGRHLIGKTLCLENEGIK